MHLDFHHHHQQQHAGERVSPASYESQSRGASDNMDIPALTALLSTSTSSLASLHAQLGHPPDKLQEALSLLAETVRSTVDTQLKTVRAEVEQVSRECEVLRARADGLRQALGEDHFAPGTKRGKTGKKSGEAAANETLLIRRERLQQDVEQLQNAYTSRTQQIDTLLEHIQHFAPVLEGGSTADMSTDEHTPDSDADDPPVPALPNRETVTIASIDPGANDALSASSDIIPAATNAYVHALTAHLNGLHSLQQARTDRFQAKLQHIFDLWGTLHLRPEIETDAFERSICLAAGVKPVLNPAMTEVEDEATGEVCLVESFTFQGQFVEMGEEEELVDGVETPILMPSVTTLRRLRELIRGLEAERTSREARIQMLYDELFVLWSRFDCDESEMDDFVLDNKGLSLTSIRAYESELEKMNALKAQHSLTFIRRIREQMEQYSNSARLTQGECEALFPEFFVPLPDTHSNVDTLAQPQPAYDGLLAAHEQAIPRILALLEAKAPIMRLVERYEEVCNEEEELTESAKNTARLFAGAKKGAGAPGGAAKVEKPKRDPGRLLREERMRKRVKVLKPKLEADMLKAIPAWEDENAQAFMLDGERYMDKLQGIVAARKPVSSIPPVSSTTSLAGQKRARQGSVGPSPAPTPSVSRVNSLSMATPLGPSFAHNRNVSASSSSTVSRGKAPPQTPMQAPTAKKARVGSATSGSASGTGAGSVRTGSRLAGPGVGRSASNAQASSVSSTLARTPSALQAKKRMALAVGGGQALVPQPTKRSAPGAVAKSNAGFAQAAQPQQPVITLLPPSAPFRPRPSVGHPFAMPAGDARSGHYADSGLQQQRVVSTASNASMATSNAGTVIVHRAVPQRSLFGPVGAEGQALDEHNVTAPLSIASRKVSASETPEEPAAMAATDTARSRANRSRPSLSLQKSLRAPAEVPAAGGSNGATSSSMRLVSSEIARRLGTGGIGANGAAGPTEGSNWDRLMEEEEDDDLDEQELMMASVAEESELSQQVDDAPTHLPEGGDMVRRSARVAAAAH